MSSFADIGISFVQLIKTSGDLGQVIRARRKELKWNQSKLAEQIGVSRQWIIDIEKGKPRAELGLVLRTIYALGLSMHMDQGKPEVLQPTAARHVDIDRIIERNKRNHSTGIDNDIFRRVREQDRLFEHARQMTSGIPDDLRKLMREQNSLAEMAKQSSIPEAAKQMSSSIPDDLQNPGYKQKEAPAKKEKRSRKKPPASGGKTG